MAIGALRLVVCWNHVDGMAVWWVSPSESLDNSFHMAFALCRRCCGEFVASVPALKASLFVLDESAGSFHGGLVGAGNCMSGIPRSSWVVHPSLPKWSIVIGVRA